jgi:adenosylcobinamide-GDP ribazoletransferase
MKMSEEFLELSAHFMFLFPVVGALIGLFAGFYSSVAHYLLAVFFGFVNMTLFHSSQTSALSFFAKGLASILTLAFLLVLTGLQHTDGLVDLGNALGMRKVSVEDRAKIAHAWIVTRTGALLALLVAVVTVLLIFLAKTENTIQSLVVAEASAKLAMVTCAWQGSSPQKGLGSIFIDSMRNRHSFFLISLGSSLVLGVILLNWRGILAIVSGIVVGGFAVVLGEKVFGGVTGDIFGAANEIARMVALSALVW